MPLPKIATPSYELELPSTGKTIQYRPFLVKEEKLLVIALESEDMKQITNAIKAVIRACVLTKGIKVETLPTFYIEYLFLNIRGKSVREDIAVNITCPDDEKTTVEMTIDLETIKVKKNKSHQDTIKLDDNLSLKLKYPSMDQFIENNFEVGNESIGNTMQIITSCIDMIYNDEESWDASDSTQKELENFIDQLNTQQFKTIESFFDTMPKLSHKITVTNPKTGVKSDVVLEGLAAFFN